MKALIIETAFPGDVVLSLALAEELYRIVPGVDTTYLVRPDAAEIVRHSPVVSNVVVYDKRGSESGLNGIKAKAAELNRLRFDIVFVLHGSARTRRLVEMLEADRKIGFASKHSALYTHDVARPDHLRKTQQVVSLLQSISAEASLDALPKLDVPTPDHPFLLGESPVAIAPGSAWRTKQWPAEHFRELADRLIKDGYRIVILGSPEDRELGNIISQRQNADKLIDLIGKTSYIEAASWIKACRLLVANDSAPIHLATAVETRSLAIFGPTIPEFGFGPPPTLGGAVQLDGLWCRPCTTHGSSECPIHTHECMRGLSVQSVYSRAIEQLALVTMTSLKVRDDN